MDKDEDSCDCPSEEFSAMVQNVENIKADDDDGEGVDCPVSELDDSPLVGEYKTDDSGDSHEDRERNISLPQSQHKGGEKTQKTENGSEG